MRLLPLAAALAAVSALPALAQGTIEIGDAYARSSNAMAGAAFMSLTNTGDTTDRLVSVASDIAARTELHMHVADGDVMRMVRAEEGFELPPGETVLLERGGKHVMFMGLTEAMEDGDTVTVTLTFETAGDVTVEIPVDLDRMPATEGHGGMHNGGEGSDG